MPEQYRAMVLLAAWCALRFGELTELRRRDIIIIDPAGLHGVVRIERAVVRVSRRT
jgi:integrase